MSPEQFLEQLNGCCEGWEREHRFYPGRRCAFDYANPDKLIAIEIEGGCWMSQAGKKSRHFTGSGASADMVKYNAAQRRGWTLFRYPDSNKNISAKTLAAVRRDLKVWLTGIEDGQQTLNAGKQKTVSELL